MQILHRKGGNRGQGPADDAGAGARAPDGLGASSAGISAEDELEIRASQITAAAVAAAAVTSSVVVTAAEAQAQLQAAPETAVSPPVAQAPMPHGAAASPQGAWLVSLLTLAAIGLALWWSAQWPWPERALRPMAPHLPALTKHRPASPAAARRLAAAPEAVTAPAPVQDEIALLQQEAEEKARLLAQKRAAAEARHRREDAEQALREQRRREADAQLAAARARAESALLVAPETPAAVAPVAPPLAEQVQQCRALSLFAREGCLWKLCNGRWGKDGCPSYQRDNEGA